MPKKSVKKKTAARTAKTTKPKKKAAKTKAKSAKKTSKSPAKRKKPKSPKAKAKKKAVSLGRPKVPGTEDLDLLFRENYHARQVFAFLRVKTVKELEQFGPEEIVEQLSRPIRQTVEQIRRILAQKNRHLASDLEFALEYHRARAEQTK